MTMGDGKVDYAIKQDSFGTADPLEMQLLTLKVDGNGFPVDEEGNRVTDEKDFVYVPYDLTDVQAVHLRMLSLGTHELPNGETKRILVTMGPLTVVEVEAGEGVEAITPKDGWVRHSFERENEFEEEELPDTAFDDKYEGDVVVVTDDGSEPALPDEKKNNLLLSVETKVG